MPAETTALSIQPDLLLAIIAVAVFAGAGVERLLAQLRRRAWRKRNPRQGDARSWKGDAEVVAFPTSREPGATKPPDAADQLRIVMGAEFSVQPLLNKSEARVFKELDRMVIACNPTWQVMAQVSLGEILRSRDAQAYGCINSKRVDLLLVDEHCRPRHAVEYQGGAHHQGTAAARDAVKKEALRRAGIGYHEVVAGQTTPAELRRLVEKLVERAGAIG